MKNPGRDLLVLFRHEFMSEQSIEHEVDCLNEILLKTESAAAFCVAHELVYRNSITDKTKRLLEVLQVAELKPFHFLINKN